MKKFNILKTIVVILLAIMAILLTSCTPGWDEYIYTEFAASGDGYTVKRHNTDESTEEYIYVGEASSSVLLGNLFMFANTVDFDDRYAYVYAQNENAPLLYLEYGDGGVGVFAKQTETAAAAAMRSFLERETSGTVAIADLDNMRQKLLSESEKNTLFSTPDGQYTFEVDVKDLKGNLVGDIIAYDQNRILALKIGAMFMVDGECCMVDFADLDNSYFDADGNFSYRRGTVTVEKLNSEKSTIYKGSTSYTTYIDNRIAYEEGLYIGEEEEDDELTDAAARAVVIVAISIIGLLLPLLVMLFVLFFGFTRRNRALLKGEDVGALPIPFYLVGAGGALWFLAGVAMLLIVILV